MTRHVDCEPLLLKGVIQLVVLGADSERHVSTVHETGIFYKNWVFV